MHTHTIEGVTGIASSVLAYVRGKKIDKLDHYISSARKTLSLGAAKPKAFTVTLSNSENCEIVFTFRTTRTTLKPMILKPSVWIDK